MFFYIEGVIITFDRLTYTESKYEKTTNKVFSDKKKKETTTKKPDARSRNITLELNDFQPTVTKVNSS